MPEKPTKSEPIKSLEKSPELEKYLKERENVHTLQNLAAAANMAGGKIVDLLERAFNPQKNKFKNKHKTKAF